MITGRYRLKCEGKQGITLRLYITLALYVIFVRRTREIQAVKLAKEIGGAKAAAELGIPENTMYAWTKAAREGRLDTGSGSYTPQTAMSLAEELAALLRQVKAQEKEIRRLKEENEFPEEAGAFFAAGRRKSAKSRE